MSLVLLALLLLGCEGGKDGQDSGVALIAPALQHVPPSGDLLDGGDVVLTVTATDADGLDNVLLLFRDEGETGFEIQAMTPGDDDTWTATVDPLSYPALEYYFRAQDAGSPPMVAELPAEGKVAPFSLGVRVDGLDLPFNEDFEPEGSEGDLYDMGWWTPSSGFQGYPWQLGEGEDGGTVAFHPRGAVDGQVLADWLISPPLDLSQLDQAMVVWRESGSNTSVGTHGLYISTTERDPSLGGYTAIDEPLAAPPEDEWGRSVAYDLSAWAGSPVVYLAWYYEGEVADDWRVDDISVRALAPDISASLSWDPDPVHPGESTTLTVAFSNATDAATSGLIATLSAPEGGVTIADDTATVGGIDPYGDASAEFQVTVDPELDDNRAVPLQIELTDGMDVWSFDVELIVGQASDLSLTVTLDEAAAVLVSVGVGDPDAPTLKHTLYSGSLAAGESVLSLDITDDYAWLPPAAGENRWFAVVQSTSAGTVDAFTIDYGGETFAATDLPDLDPSDASPVVWLPEPPDPRVLAVSTSVDPLAPGSEGVALSIQVYNAGEDTAGPVTGTLSSADPDLTLVSGDTFAVTSGRVWYGGTLQTITAPVIGVSADHTDSSPIVLDLTLDDGVESWLLEVEVEVPWPNLRVLSVEIDDRDEGDDDGQLDPGETAELIFTVANVGDLDTFSRLDATLSVADGSTVSATTNGHVDSVGSIASGNSRDTDGHVVTVTSGAVGESLDLVLSFDDGIATYEAAVSVPLGETPWEALGTGDPAGDVLDDYDFDFVSAYYRVVDGQLTLWLSSDTPYNEATLFLEIWGLSSGADYTYYRIVYQSGVGKLQGYNSGVGFMTIGEVEGDPISDTDILLILDTADMGLLLDQLELGLAAGWCGPDEYFCDHYPDNWGYPYDSFTTSGWFSLSW